MPVAIQHERDNVYRVQIDGTLRKADLAACEAQLAVEMARLGPVRLLFDLTRFVKLEPHTGWNDLSFYATRGDAIERIAIVGPPRLRSRALMFANADLRRAPVMFFPIGTAADARAWLSS